MSSSLLCLLLAQDAFAVPLQMNHQGRLLDSDGNGLTGSHELIFRIFDDPENGYEMWTETQTVNFINGYYSVLLGADEENNALDDSVFANYPLHLELKVDGETLEPRHQMVSVPYAQIAGVAESVDGGTVNASEINVGGQAVINADGQWVGEAPTVDFMNLQNRPQGLDDGDDNTQLSQLEVVDYVNGSQVNLGSASQVDGSDIVTAGSFNGYLPTDLADGDNDLLASISCALGEIISWDGNASWICVSDNTLELSDIAIMLANNPMDLNSATTIGGLDIVTSIDDSDTLASLSCQNDGDIARYDLVLDEWYCSTDIDTDTQLDQAGVLVHVNGEALSLASGTQVNGSDVVTVDTFVSNLPSDLADGDADTQLDQAGVLGFVDGQTINLGTGSQVNSSNIVTAGGFDTYLPTDLADGDADTLASLSCAQGELVAWDGNSSWVCVSDNTLDESTVEGYITNGAIDLYAGSQVDGNAILSSTSQLDWNKLDNVPNGLADGDNDTQLAPATVVSYVESGSVNLAQGSQVNSRNIVGQPTACTNGQVLVYNSANNDWECGDDTDTTLTPTEMQTMIEALSLNLQNVPQVNGADVLTVNSTLNTGNLDVSTGSDGQVLTVSSGVASWEDGGGCEWVTSDSTTNRALIDCNGVKLSVIFSEPQTSISAGHQHACSVGYNGNITCWGRDNFGQSSPQNGAYTEVGSGYQHTCALSTNEQIQCWGRNDDGQTNAPSGSFTHLSVGHRNNCVIDATGEAQCWGEDNHGQSSSVPSVSFIDISAAGHHTCGVDTNGNLHCWGRNDYGQTNAPSGSFISVSNGAYHSCALSIDNEIQCWGRNDYGQTNAPSGSFNDIHSGYFHTCAISTNDTLECWGSNTYGESNNYDPEGVFSSVSGGNVFSCALGITGEISCWGLDTNGQVSNIP